MTDSSRPIGLTRSQTRLSLVCRQPRATSGTFRKWTSLAAGGIQYGGRWLPTEISDDYGDSHAVIVAGEKAPRAVEKVFRIRGGSEIEPFEHGLGCRVRGFTDDGCHHHDQHSERVMT